jgi:regulator of protease activity HflC (stomatin/prohibitin superfamily)
VNLAVLVVLVVVLALIGAAIAMRLIGSITIRQYERGLRFVRGRFVGLADAGTVYYPRPTTEIRVLDVRPTSMAIDGQEVMTSDLVALKISLVARYLIGDAAAYVLSDSASGRTMYFDIQLGLREIVAGRTLEEVLATRTTMGPEILALVAPQVMTIGLELTAIEVRDVMVPSELKRAFAAVVVARTEGAAALERARGETAALRSAANARRMVSEDPGPVVLERKRGRAAADGAGGPAAAPTTTVARRRRSRPVGPASEV